MENKQQFVAFGNKLKAIRLKSKKTINDVSGAVELPVDQLKRIEKGSMQPAEELVCLLASYFKLSRSETKTWLRLAGYDANAKSDPIADQLRNIIRHMTGGRGEVQQLWLAVPEASPEDRVLYTDETSVNVSRSGVVVEFLASNSAQRQQKAKSVAKVGMSVEHARQLCGILQRALTNLKADDSPVDRNA